MQLARALKKNPREIATQIVEALKANPESEALIKSVEIAGPGFINLRIQDNARQEIIRQVLKAGHVLRLRQRPQEPVRSS